jgi:hypothetical protein
MEKPVAMIVGGVSDIGADAARNLEASEPDPDFPTACQRNPAAWPEDLVVVTQKCVSSLKLFTF